MVFAQTGILTGASSDYSGTVLTYDGTAYGVSGLPTGSLGDQGNGHSYAFTSPLVVIGSTKEYVWVSTTGISGVSGQSGSVKNLAGTITGNYKTQYAVTFAKTGTGTVNPAGTNIWEDDGTLSISATPGSHYHFSSWSSSTPSITFANVNNPSTTATIHGSGTITANFMIDQVTLTVTVSGTGSGTVKEGTTDHTSSFTKTYDYGASASLTATADASSNFAGWTGAGSGTSPRSITMNGDQSVTAAFTLKIFAITVAQSDHGTIAPGTTNVDYDGSQAFSITPDTGYHIATVTVDGSPAAVASPYTFTNVRATHTITASFAVTIHSTSLTINVDPKSPETVDKYSGLHATISGYLSSSGVGLKNLNGYDVIVSYNDGRTDLNNDGQSDWIVLGSPTTANNPDTSTTGFYTIDFPVTSSMANGYVAFKAEFAGDLANGYAPTNPNTPAVTGTAGQEEGNLHVVPEYLFGGLAALGVCFVGFVAFKKRSSLPHFKQQ